MNRAAGPIAWEDESAPFPANLALTWWECLTYPDRFFARVSWAGPFSRPLLYFLFVAILAGLLSLFWFAWGPWGAAEQLGLTLEIQLLSFFLTPFAVLFGLGLVALGQHLFVMLLVPGRRGIAATATVLCYGSGVGLVTAILPPPLGSVGFAPEIFRAIYVVSYVSLVVALQVWYVIVLVSGLRQAHSTTTGRAAAAVLLPMGIGLVLAVVLIMVAITLVALSEFPI